MDLMRQVALILPGGLLLSALLACACIATRSDAFSFPPRTTAPLAPTLGASAIASSRNIPALPPLNTRSIARSSSYDRRRGDGSLFAGSGGGIIPSYDELMERLPPKKVLQAVEKSKGGPIVASGECNDSFRVLAARY